MAVTVSLVFACLVAVAFGEIAKFKPCSEGEGKCTISQVRIDPCDPKKSYCEFIKGNNVSMEFDFTPQFSTNKLKIEVTWHGLPFAGLTTSDACELTACPTTSGQQQTFKYGLSIGTKLPKGTFNSLWKLTNEDNSNDVCCFETNIKLTNPKKKP